MGNYKVVLEKVSYEWHYPKAGDVYKLFADEEGVVFILLGEEVETVTSEYDGEVISNNISRLSLHEFETDEAVFFVQLEDFVDEYTEIDPRDIMDEDEVEEFLNILKDDEGTTLEDVLDFEEEDEIDDMPLYLNTITQEVYELMASEYLGGEEVSEYILLNLDRDFQIRVSPEQLESYFILIDEEVEEFIEAEDVGKETPKSKLKSWEDQDEAMESLENAENAENTEQVEDQDKIETIKDKLTRLSYLMSLTVDKMDKEDLEAFDREISIQLGELEAMNLAQE